MRDYPPGVTSSRYRHSSLSILRTSLFKFVGLLTAVLLLTGYLLIYLAKDLDRTEEAESAFYTAKAIQALEKTVSVTVKDYAFWGDAYKYLLSTIDTDWAYVRQNLGSTLFTDFGFQGIFVVDDNGQTGYSVIDGELKAIDASKWLKQLLSSVLDQARRGGRN